MPYGLEGGLPGGLGRNTWIKQGREEDGDAPEGDFPKTREINIGGKATISMGKGDRIRIETPGGGGWGVASEKYGLEGDTTEFVSGWAARGSLAERSAAQAEF
jgi:5-oxoprolinase (ATP-hydrolysing)